MRRSIGYRGYSIWKRTLGWDIYWGTVWLTARPTLKTAKSWIDRDIKRMGR